MQNTFVEVHRHLRNLKRFLSKNRKAVPLVVGLVLLGGLQVVQLAYSGDRMLPGASVDGVSVSGMNKSEAVDKLDGLYNKQKIAVRLGDMEDIALTPTFADIGTTTSNEERINSAGYPWYLRIIPTSIFWAAYVIDYGQPEITKDSQGLDDYMNSGVKGSCSVDSRPASLKSNGDKLELVPSKVGLRCEDEDLKSALEAVEPDISKDRVDAVVAAEKFPPEVNDGVANDFARHIERNTNGGVSIEVAGSVSAIPQKDVLAWLDFTPTESGSLDVFVNSERASSYLSDVIESRVKINPGVSRINTHNFVETGRKNGKAGRGLDVAKTVSEIRRVVIGDSDRAKAVLASVSPRVEYTRTYDRVDSDLNAVLSNFVKNHEGKFSISMIELSGDRRRAEYRADDRFTTANIHELFVAYSTLLRVESGKFSWSDQARGEHNLSACFDAMMAELDSPCSDVLLERSGLNAISEDANNLGLSRTTLVRSGGPLTTSHDLMTFLATLESGQMLNSASRTKLLNAMSGGAFRQGIPAGAKGKVINKVGFSGDTRHDAAIVNSANGKYVLVVLSEGANWQDIAKLTQDIERFRNS